jgi:hypothetical protein
VPVWCKINTPEFYFGVECYGRATSATAKRLLASSCFCACWRARPATEDPLTVSGVSVSVENLRQNHWVFAHGQRDYALLVTKEP